MGGGASAFKNERPSSAPGHLPAARNRPDSAATPAFEPPQNAKVSDVLACLYSRPRPEPAARSTCRQHAFTRNSNRSAIFMLHILQLLLAQVLLKKELQYPYAWRPHKAYLYSNGWLIFVEHVTKADKAGAQDSELSGIQLALWQRGQLSILIVHTH